MQIAVLGGGNGSFAAAGDFALAGHEVRLWRRDRRRSRRIARPAARSRSRIFTGRREAAPPC